MLDGWILDRDPHAGQSAALCVELDLPADPDHAGNELAIDLDGWLKRPLVLDFDPF
jgi:hypothetical protein